MLLSLSSDQRAIFSQEARMKATHTPNANWDIAADFSKCVSMSLTNPSWQGILNRSVGMFSRRTSPMTYSSRPFHSITQVADRWSVPPIDIVDWAIEGRLALSIAVPPIRVVSSIVLCGLIEVAGTDVRPLFLPEGARSSTVAIGCLREHGTTEWQWIADASNNGAINITASDVLVKHAEADRFEQRFLLDRDTGSPSVRRVHRVARTRPAGPGAPPRYDWDRFFAEIARRIYVHGLPRTQSELVREMADWFQSRQQAPDESTIRRKVALVWRELMGGCVLPFILCQCECIVDCSPLLL